MTRGQSIWGRWFTPSMTTIRRGRSGRLPSRQRASFRRQPNVTASFRGPPACAGSSKASSLSQSSSPATSWQSLGLSTTIKGLRSTPDQQCATNQDFPDPSPPRTHRVVPVASPVRNGRISAVRPARRRAGPCASSSGDNGSPNASVAFSLLENAAISQAAFSRRATSVPISGSRRSRRSCSAHASKSLAARTASTAAKTEASAPKECRVACVDSATATANRGRTPAQSRTSVPIPDCRPYLLTSPASWADTCEVAQRNQASTLAELNDSSAIFDKI